MFLGEGRVVLMTCSVDLPYAQTSDLLLNLLYKITSSAAHLMGNLVPSDAVYSSSITYLEGNNMHPAG